MPTSETTRLILVRAPNDEASFSSGYRAELRQFYSLARAEGGKISAFTFTSDRADGGDGFVGEFKVPCTPNNMIEQDHRNVKSRTKVMLGFKWFRNAATTISGIELMHRIRKGQFDLWALGFKDTAAPTVWNAVLSNKYRILIYRRRLGLTSYLHQNH
jgi:hypothetical protein